MRPSTSTSEARTSWRSVASTRSALCAPPVCRSTKTVELERCAAA